MNKHWLVLLSGVLISGAVFVAVRGVNAQPSGPIGDARPSDAIVVRVQTPHYQLDRSGLRVPGYDINGVPGAPALPVYNTLVELPADGDYQLAVEVQGTQLLAERVEIPAAPGAAPAPIGPEALKPAMNAVKRICTGLNDLYDKRQHVLVGAL